MYVAVITKENTPMLEYASDTLNDINLNYFASEAARQMNFSELEELEEAVKRAYNLCISADISLQRNFKRVYRCSPVGIICDWKLSILAYHLVCLNGGDNNKQVAEMQIRLLKDDYLKQF